MFPRVFLTYFKWRFVDFLLHFNFEIFWRWILSSLFYYWNHKHKFLSFFFKCWVDPFLFANHVISIVELINICNYQNIIKIPLISKICLLHLEEEKKNLLQFNNCTLLLKIACFLQCFACHRAIYNPFKTFIVIVIASK